MSAPLMLDLYCKAGGAGMGYKHAGWQVVGVDHGPQPNYPFEFHQEDALAFLARRWHDFDAAHASPPCQNDTAYNRRPDHVGPVPELIAPTRELLRQTGLPYVIENVPGAPLLNPIQLCGSSFGLDVRRHRLFETNWGLLAPPCNHSAQQGDYPQATNRENRRKTCEIGVWRIPLEDQKRAMGVDWDCTLHELSQMVPPAYTKFVGEVLYATLSDFKREALAA